MASGRGSLPHHPSLRIGLFLLQAILVHFMPLCIHPLHSCSSFCQDTLIQSPSYASPYFLHSSTECVNTSASWLASLSLRCSTPKSLLIPWLLSLFLGVTPVIRFTISSAVVSESLSSFLLSVRISAPSRAARIQYEHAISLSLGPSLVAAVRHTPSSSITEINMTVYHNKNYVRYSSTYLDVDACFQPLQTPQDKRQTEYPRQMIGGDLHQAHAPMRPFWPLHTVHGLSDHYTNYYYECSPRPINCIEDRQCESDLLWCDRTMGRCRAKVCRFVCLGLY